MHASLWLGLSLALVASLDAPDCPLEVEPTEVHLRGSDASAQLLVTGNGPDAQPADLTSRVEYEVSDPGIAEVGPDGLVRPRRDGATEIIVHDGNRVARLRVVVEDFDDERLVPFTAEVVPILTKLGCNAGGCHGKATGQNGFRLSLLGFDPAFDFEALVRDGRGRRVFPAAPASSLLLAKATAAVPHGGGRKIEPGSPEYRTIARWIGQGMPYNTGNPPKLTGLDVSPEQRTVARRESQQLRVVAHYDDGSTADVTRLAQYQSNAPDLAAVDERGLAQARDGVGEAAIMARFGGQVAVARVLVPMANLPDEFASWEPPEPASLVDPFVFGKLRELGLPPSGPCTDAEFARRAALDVCGVLPTPEEVMAFESDPTPGPLKRARYVDALLAKPEYADLFAMKWSAILRNTQGNAGTEGLLASFAFHAWVRQALASNLSYDQFASELIAARGSPETNPAVAWYRLRQFNQDNPEEQVEDTAQLFLGMRIQCARCHHHPFEKWGQDDYYGFASIFARVGRKGGGDPFLRSIYVLPEGKSRHPDTQEAYEPKALDGPTFSDLGPRDDPRDALVEWLRQPENPFFARALVNRYWKHFFNRGLVEPEDDMRTSNPPTNPELLDALAADFIGHGYDLKHLVRTIVTSEAYARSSLPNAFNGQDTRYFARYYPRRLPAEVLLDAINNVTGTTESFQGLPKGHRAIALPDEQSASYFLEVFGRPKRESVCECERDPEANLTQRLHLLNSNEIEAKLSDKEGRVTAWADDANDPRPEDAKVDQLYRLAYGRGPTAEERDACLDHLTRKRTEGKLADGYQDLVWALINSKEFLFNR